MTDPSRKTNRPSKLVKLGYPQKTHASMYLLIILKAENGHLFLLNYHCFYNFFLGSKGWCVEEVKIEKVNSEEEEVLEAKCNW